jgi:hypothetical protein
MSETATVWTTNLKLEQYAGQTGNVETKGGQTITVRYNMTDKRNIEVCLCEHCYRGTAISNAYSLCVFVAFTNILCAQTILTSVVCPVLPYMFLYYLTNGMIFEKKKLSGLCGDLNWEVLWQIRRWDPICHNTYQFYGLGHRIGLRLAH